MYGFTSGNQTASNLTKEVFAQDSDKENDNHHVALKQDYAAYGQAKRSMLEETPQFNGEMLSSGNLTYMRARNYDSTIGQFTSKDTWLGRQTNPLSQNRNTFVENNPVNYIDPSGHWPDWGGMWNSVSNAAQNTWNAAVETTKAVVNTVVHVAQETAKAVVQTVQNVVSTVTNAVSNAWNTATRWVGNAWNTVKQGARNAWNTVKQWGSNVKNYAQQKVEQARQYAEHVKREAVRKYEQAKQAVSQAVNKAKDMGIQLVFKAGMTLQQQLEYTKKIIQICSDKVSAVAEKAKDNISSLFSTFAEDMKKNLQNPYWVTNKLGSLTSTGLVLSGKYKIKTANDLLYKGLTSPEGSRVGKVALESAIDSADNGMKLLKYGKYLGKAMPVIGFGLGVASDMHFENKTTGEAIAHNGFTAISGGLVLGAAALIGLSPVGWVGFAVAGAATLVSIGTNQLYEHNNWVKEKVDGVGHKIDEGLKWIDKNLNPFNWGK